MYFPNAFRKSFLVSSGTLASGVATNALTAGQIGMYAPTSATNSTLATLAASITPFYVIQGSYFSADKIGSHGGYKESIKSKLVNPKYISRVIKISGKSAVNQVVRVTANGTGLTADETYRLRLDIKGSPALRFLNHQLYRTLDYWAGCADATTPSLKKDPVMALLAWKDQINSYPIFDQMVKARVYAAAGAASAAASVASVTTTSAAITWASIPAYAAVGQKVTGTGIPANAFITAIVSNTATVTYPTQAVAPTIGGTVSVSFWNDLYSEAVSGSVFIPGTSVVSDTSVATSGNGAIVYSAAANAASFTYSNGKPHIEFTLGYVETSFGACTFTPTDKYELEPLVAYAAVVDESGDVCLASSFDANAAAVTASNPYLSSHGVEIQAPVQASGLGETVLRELILDGRYLQNAYPDSSRVDSLRMREIEADPALGQVTRSSLYDKVLVLHNVPRWNNPTSTFDNDQYLLVFNVTAGTSTTAITNYFVTAANAAQGANTIALESY
jgi:hypothetical protein